MFQRSKTQTATQPAALNSDHSNLINIKAETIYKIGTALIISRTKPILFEKKEYEDKNDPLVKNKINFAMRVLFAVVMNVNDNNVGNKTKLLQLVDQTLHQNHSDKWLEGYWHIHLHDVKRLLEQHMIDEQAPFMSPPDDMTNLELARPVACICRKYVRSASWPTFVISAETLQMRYQIALDAINIWFNPIGISNRWEKLEALRDKCFALEEKKGSIKSSFSMLEPINSTLFPYHRIKDVFFENGAQNSAKDLSKIVMDYYDESPEVFTKKSG